MDSTKPFFFVLIKLLKCIGPKLPTEIAQTNNHSSLLYYNHAERKKRPIHMLEEWLELFISHRKKTPNVSSFRELV